MNTIIYNYISSKVSIKTTANIKHDNAHYNITNKNISISENLIKENIQGGEYILAHEYGHYILDTNLFTSILQRIASLFTIFINNIVALVLVVIMGYFFPVITGIVTLFLVANLLLNELTASIIGMLTIFKLKTMNRKENIKGFKMLYNAWITYVISSITFTIIGILSYLKLVTVLGVSIIILITTIVYISIAIKKIHVYLRYIKIHIFKGDYGLHEYNRSLNDQ